MLISARQVPLGGLRDMQVRRTLPHRHLTTIGAWCFLDRFGPGHDEMLVLPHPHTGLQTVTWPLEGRIHHRDSVGSDVFVRPGELNLMTAGRGVSHSEISDAGRALSGVQFWIAQPESARHGDPGFEQHVRLPLIDGTGWEGVLLMGELDRVVSPATTFTPLVGAQLTLTADDADIPLELDFEHGILPIDGPLRINDEDVAEGDLWYIQRGATRVRVNGPAGQRLVLIGGEPFGEQLVMWWNFIGRNHDEVEEARRQWEASDDRFGRVVGHSDDERIPAPPLPGVRLRPRPSGDR